MSAGPPIVLASGSRHRRALLERLQVPFTWHSSDVDESAAAGEAPAALAARLAAAKAAAVAATDAGDGAARRLVIGGDQVAECDGTILGKPGTTARAAAQLRRCAGREVRFHTAVCLLDTASGERHEHLDLTRVRFRPLTEREIASYLARESALDCAGAFRSEGLGVALTERLESADPTALIGLPLIWLAGALRAAGWALPG